MDPLRTLLLARTDTVVLDPDRVATAATRPSRDSDLDRFEEELLDLGFVMSLDLAMTVRRLPQGAIRELRTWIVTTLTRELGAHRPHVPLFRSFPASVPDDTHGLYARRVLSWLATQPDHPCPWCGELKAVAPLDPCGHLVCRSCWDLGEYSGCPICHRRIAASGPFLRPIVRAPSEPRDVHGHLRLLHLAFDVAAVAQARLARLLGRATPLAPRDRAEVETIIDAIGARAVAWLPARIPVRATMAIAVARLWIVSADRATAVRAVAGHLRSATDVLRVAVALLGGDPELIGHGRLRSLGRPLRRAVLDALDRLPREVVLEDMRRHAAWWKRVGERLHPFEDAARRPTATLGFAAVRGTDLATATFADALRADAIDEPTVRIVGDRLRVRAWAGPIEEALRAGDAAAAVAGLAARPGELLRRADHLLRRAADPVAQATVLTALGHAVDRGPPALLLTLGAHVARRDAAWPRRIFLPRGEVLRAWATADDRPPLPAAARTALVDLVDAELLRRAGARRHFARAILDRGLRDLPMPVGERTASPSRLAWPRGSTVAIPTDAPLRLFLHWEQPPDRRVDLDLSVAMFDAAWRHVATCDFTNLVCALGAARAAVHSGDLTSAPPPLGASEFVDLDLAALAAGGVRHVVMVVFSYNGVPFDRLPHGFAGLMYAPRPGAPFDPRAVTQRFDLHGRARVALPLVCDVVAGRLRWLDVHLTDDEDQQHVRQVGGFRATLAHAARDLEALFATGARPTLWDVATLHATARANLVYVRHPGGRIVTVRRRAGEGALERLRRLRAGVDHDGELAAIPAADAPTFAALVGDVAMPAGSTAYVLDGRQLAVPGLERLAAADLVADLALAAGPRAS